MRQKKIRKCIKCGCDISGRGNNAKRCISCALDDKKEKIKGYKSGDKAGKFVSEDEAYLNLAAAILKGSLASYENTLIRLQKNPGSSIVANSVIQQKRAICSDYYSTLSCGIDIKAAAEKMEKKYIGIII